MSQRLNFLSVWAVAMFGLLIGASRVAAQPVNPKVHQAAFEKAKADAELVAKVRVLAAVCTATMGEGKAKSVTLQVSLQLLDVEKGAAKKNDVLVVSHKVNLPAGPGPGMYGYWGAVHRFPFVPGVKGEVALKWDKEGRHYAVVSGWVAEPNRSVSAIPTEAGKAYVAGDTAAKEK
jgi:hypothetical protein